MRCLWLVFTAVLLFGFSWAEPTELVDLRATFPAIKPYTQPASAPHSRKFSVPGPGRLRVHQIESPWYRSTGGVAFRSPGGTWGAFPKAQYVGSRFHPEPLLEGKVAESWWEYRISEEVREIEVGLFPSVVRHGDGSITQLPTSLQVTVQWQPDPVPRASVTWQVVETTASGDRWDATWTMLSDGRSFDGVWVHQPGGDSGKLVNFCRIRSIQGSKIEIERPGLGTYFGDISSDRRHIRGTPSWAPGGRWEATLSQPLP